MPRIAIRKSRPSDIEKIVPHVREADRQELWALMYVTPEMALREAMRFSDRSYTGTVDGRPVVMFGVCDAGVLGDIGNVWLIGTDEIERYALHFLYNCPKYLRKMKKQYGMLSNYIDARNKVAIRWLRWLGFNFEKPEPVGPFKLPFHRFWMKGDVAHV